MIIISVNRKNRLKIFVKRGIFVSSAPYKFSRLLWCPSLFITTAPTVPIFRNLSLMPLTADRRRKIVIECCYYYRRRIILAGSFFVPCKILQNRESISLGMASFVCDRMTLCVLDKLCACLFKKRKNKLK